MPAPVLNIARLGLNVADLERACAFYANALGFHRLAPVQSAKDLAVLRLGTQEVELRQTGGLPYPQPRAANDPWFQHFAIAVSDMDRAYRQLSRYAQQPISQGGPQLLPPSTGSVTAYKFRDPDGHPLELSHIPESDWLAKGHKDDDTPFLGIDHSAIAVRDLDASVRFYTQVLGLADAGRFLNRGPEQDRLDGLRAACVDIAVLKTAEPGPHIELLHYRSPIPGSADLKIAYEDLAAIRMTLRVSNLADVRARLTAERIAWSSDAEDPRTSFQDPDGHWLDLLSAECGPA